MLVSMAIHDNGEIQWANRQSNSIFLNFSLFVLTLDIASYLM